MLPICHHLSFRQALKHYFSWRVMRNDLRDFILGTLWTAVLALVFTYADRFLYWLAGPSYWILPSLAFALAMNRMERVSTGASYPFPTWITVKVVSLYFLPPPDVDVGVDIAYLYWSAAFIFRLSIFPNALAWKEEATESTFNHIADMYSWCFGMLFSVIPTFGIFPLGVLRYFLYSVYGIGVLSRVCTLFLNLEAFKQGPSDDKGWCRLLPRRRLFYKEWFF